MNVPLRISERIYRAYLIVMVRVAKKIRPNKFSRWEKRLALYVPKSLLVAMQRDE